MVPQRDPYGEIGPFPETSFTYISLSTVKEPFLQVPIAPIETGTKFLGPSFFRFSHFQVNEPPFVFPNRAHI
jgi:hypothetical protein